MPVETIPLEDIVQLSTPTITMTIVRIVSRHHVITTDLAKTCVHVTGNESAVLQGIIQAFELARDDATTAEGRGWLIDSYQSQILEMMVYPALRSPKPRAHVTAQHHEHGEPLRSPPKA